MAERVTHIFDCPDIITQLASSSGGALVSWRQEGVSAGLRSVAAKLNEIVCVEDFVQSGDADDTLRIQRAAAEIRARGGGTLWFKHGKAYTVLTSGAVQTLILLTGCRGVTIELNGATITSARVYPSALGDTFVNIDNAQGVTVRNGKFVGSNSVLGNGAVGEYAVLYSGTTPRGILVENMTFEGCLSGVQRLTSKSSTLATGITIRNCYFERTFYPIVFYNSENVKAYGLKAINSGRSVFIVAPCYSLDIDIETSQTFASADVLISSTGDSTLADEEFYSTIAGLKLRYRTNGRYAGGNACTDSAIYIDFRQGASTTGGVRYRDFDIDVVMNGLNSDGDAAQAPANIVQIVKRLNNGNDDTTAARGHVLDGLRISGVAYNWNQATGGIRICDKGGGTTVWTGETVRGVAIRDFVMRGAPSGGANSLYVNGEGAVANQPFLTLDGVSCEGPVSYNNVSTACIEERNSKFSNIDATSVDLRAFTPTANVVAFASAAATTIKEGRKVTIFFDVTWPATADASAAQIKGFPFTVSSNTQAQGGAISFTTAGGVTVAASAGNTYAQIYSTAGALQTNADLSGDRVVGTVTYYV